MCWLQRFDGENELTATLMEADPYYIFFFWYNGNMSCDKMSHDKMSCDKMSRHKMSRDKMSPTKNASI
jgi:hypothetical protein